VKIQKGDGKMPTPFPNKKYQIIYSDPPWSYNRAQLCNYSTQSNEWIRDLPVKDITATNCILFLWITMPKLSEILGSGLIEKWGFKYKTVAFTWVKRNKKASSWFWGMGNWTRANAELCLMATKGAPKRINASVHSVIDSPIRQHSQKPDETRTRIVKLIGDLPRIELFARQQTPGWDVWGNELGHNESKAISIKESLKTNKKIQTTMRKMGFMDKPQKGETICKS